jgi:hypothetical protein
VINSGLRVVTKTSVSGVAVPWRPLIPFWPISPPGAAGPALTALPAGGSFMTRENRDVASMRAGCNHDIHPTQQSPLRPGATRVNQRERHKRSTGSVC